jgi:hypothetical protein
MASYNSNSQDIPEEFLCPITQELMINPLMSRTGINYEKSAIMEWISKHNHTCPMTRLPLRACDLVHNRKLQSKICTWCAANGMQEACKEMPFNPDGTFRTDVQQPEEVFFGSCAMPKPKSSQSQSQIQKSKRSRIFSALNSARLFRSSASSRSSVE